MHAYRSGESGRSIGLTVCVRYVWFYVINGCAVHKIGSADMQYGALRGVEFNGVQPDARKPYGIGTER